MKKLQLLEFISSGLTPGFDNINEIEIEENPFDKGGFGEIYHCMTINGSTPAAAQVIKIFIDDSSGSAVRGYQTIKKLQSEIKSLSAKLRLQNEKPIEKVNALHALPQLSFKCVLDEKVVFGYSSNYLSSDEWLLFSRIFDDEDLDMRGRLLNTFYKQPLSQKFRMAYDLAEGFYYLERLNFIYADLNPKNIFVNQSKAKLCLIDYEGGAINDNPETFGKPGEWLAPEIQQQLVGAGDSIITVNLNSDTWSLGIAIHFMFFNYHPLFFLSVKGVNEMKVYLENCKWPDADRSDPNFRKEQEKIFDNYIRKLNTPFPESIKDAFASHINEGLLNPGRRVTSRQWMKRLADLISTPQIRFFRPERKFAICNTQVILEWEIAGAEEIFIDNNIGDVTGSSQVTVIPGKATRYTLTTINRVGSAKDSVLINVIPLEMAKDIIKPPEFNQSIVFPDFIKLTSGIRNYIAFDTKKQISVPDVFIRFDTSKQTGLKTLHKPVSSISKLFDSIKARLANTKAYDR